MWWMIDEKWAEKRNCGIEDIVKISTLYKLVLYSERLRMLQLK